MERKCLEHPLLAYLGLTSLRIQQCLVSVQKAGNDLFQKLGSPASSGILPEPTAGGVATCLNAQVNHFSVSLSAFLSHPT